jgi:hypothetical protein
LLTPRVGTSAAAPSFALALLVVWRASALVTAFGAVAFGALELLACTASCRCACRGSD